MAGVFQKGRLWILVICLVSIPVKILMESPLNAVRKEWNLEGTPLTLELRSQLSQNLAVAVLGGFRAFVADIIWIERVHISWEKQIWYKLKEGVELSVVLQPHAISFWDIGSWHMAWNASWAEHGNTKYSTLAYRLKMQQLWIDAGRDFLKNGIQNNPDHYDLYFRMGWLLREKYQNHLEAAKYFIKATEFQEVPPYVFRLVGHAYEDAGEPRLAYEWWKKIWKEQNHANHYFLWDKIRQWGADAEKDLQVPPEERVFSL